MSGDDSEHAVRLAKIGVDADASPNAIKDILFRAAERAQAHVTLTANP